MFLSVGYVTPAHPWKPFRCHYCGNIHPFGNFFRAEHKLLVHCEETAHEEWGMGHRMILSAETAIELAKEPGTDGGQGLIVHCLHEPQEMCPGKELQKLASTHEDAFTLDAFTHAYLQAHGICAHTGQKYQIGA